MRQGCTAGLGVSIWVQWGARRQLAIRAWGPIGVQPGMEVREGIDEEDPRKGPPDVEGKWGASGVGEPKQSVEIRAGEGPPG